MNTGIALHADDSIITPRVSVDPAVLTIAFHEPGQQDIYAAMDVKVFGTFEQFLDLGYDIIAAVNKIKNVPYVEDAAFSEAINSAVGPPSDAEAAFVPFAIQDDYDDLSERLDVDADMVERL